MYKYSDPCNIRSFHLSIPSVLTLALYQGYFQCKTINIFQAECKVLICRDYCTCGTIVHVVSESCEYGKKTPWKPDHKNAHIRCTSSKYSCSGHVGLHVYRTHGGMCTVMYSQHLQSMQNLNGNLKALKHTGILRPFCLPSSVSDL